MANVLRPTTERSRRCLIPRELRLGKTRKRAHDLRNNTATSFWEGRGKRALCISFATRLFDPSETLEYFIFSGCTIDVLHLLPMAEARKGPDLRPLSFILNYWPTFIYDSFLA